MIRKFFCLIALLFFTACNATDNIRPTSTATSSPNAWIITSELSAAEFVEKISTSNNVELIRTSFLLDRPSYSALDQFQTVAYLVMGDLDNGDVIETEYTYERSPTSIAAKPSDRPFTQSFTYKLEGGTPRNPLLIVNEAYSIFKGKFTFVVRLNGKQITERVVPVIDDLSR